MSNTSCGVFTVDHYGSERRLGWTSAPNYRGTFDIIWSCAFTLFLCCWSILVVNVPGPNPNQWQLVLRKLCLVGLSAMAPELVFWIALSQWLSARQSVTLFRNSNYQWWTIRHGFYANMGGLRFQPAGWKSFPINAKQLHYLVEMGYVQLPEIHEGQIRDKNKVDGMLRLITGIQALWFVVNVLMRPIQGLTVTALELSTAAFVWLGFATSLCWLSKPADVEQADVITSTKTMAEILLEGGDAAAGVYYYTPLDFVGHAEWPWSRLWNHGLNLLRRLHWAGARPPAQRPLPRFQNTIIPAVEGWYYALWVIMSSAYFAIFIAAWNFSFPTRTECYLWRAASVIALGSAWVICFTMNWCCTWYPELRSKLPQTQPDDTPQTRGTHSLQLKKRIWGTAWCYRVLAHFRNNSVMKNPSLDTPATLILVTWIFGTFYASARAYVVIADIIELRSLPASAYKTVEWSNIWPHF